MIESAPKKPIDRRFLPPHSRVFGAALAAGLATLASNTLASPQKQAHELVSSAPLSQPAPNSRRQSVQEFLNAAQQKKSYQDQKVKHSTEQIAGASAQPRMQIPATSTEDAPATAELQKLNPEGLSISPEISKIMHEDVVYLPALRCSGFLIRSENDEPIGILTAEHCSLRGIDGRWSKSKTGQTTLSFDQPFIAQTGDTMDNLTTVGEIRQFLLNSRYDTTHDMALGVFDGHTIKEVAARYKQISLPNVYSLKKGDVIYNSGWPVDQPNNPGPLKRQGFAMSVLGSANWAITNGDVLNLLVAAVPVSGPDGTECSWGNSGSAAFIVGPDGKPRIIGTASAFNDFGYLYNKGKPQDATAESNYISSTYNVDMAGYGAVCGFNYEPPVIASGAVVVTVGIPLKP